MKINNVDDYLNTVSGTAEMLDTMPIEEIDNKIDAEQVSYESMTKAELIENINHKDTVIEHYTTRVEDMIEAHKKEIADMNDYYLAHTKELTNLISYYERKLNVLKDIITIEVGGEK